MKRFQLPAKLWITDVAKLMDLPSSLELSNNIYDVDVESDDLLDLGGT